MKSEILRKAAWGTALIGLVVEGCAPASAISTGQEKVVEGPTPTLTASREYVSTGNPQESYYVTHARGTNRFFVSANYFNGLAKAEIDISKNCGRIMETLPFGSSAESITTEKPC